MAIQTFRDAAHQDGVTLVEKMKRLSLPGCAEGQEPAELESGVIFWNNTTDQPRVKNNAGNFIDLASGGTIPSLSPLRFMARPASGATPAAGVTVTDAHQVILGHGLEYTLSMFGWTSGDIYAALNAAIAAAQSSGGGIVQLPAGPLTCSASIVIPGSNIAGVTIRGGGIGGSSIMFAAGNGFFFDGSGAAPAASCGLENLHVYGSGTGTGVNLTAGLFCAFRNLHVKGWNSAGGTGMKILANGSSPGQHVYLSNVHVQDCYVGMEVDGLNQFCGHQILWNQNIHTGLKVGTISGKFTACMLQGTSPYGIRITPGTVNLEISKLSSEFTLTSTNAIVQYEGSAIIPAGRLVMSGGVDMAGGSVSQPILRASYCNLSVTGPWQGGGFDTWIEGRNLTGCLVTDASLSVGSGLGHTPYDFDTASARNTTWLGVGSVGVGTAEPPAGGSVQSRIYGTDNSYRETFPPNNFGQILSGIMGELLVGFVHAGMGLIFTRDQSLVVSWQDQVRGLVIPAIGAGVIYKADGSNFRGLPVVHTDGATSSALRLTGISPALLNTGDIPCFISVSRLKANAVDNSIFGVGVSGVSDGVYLDDSATNHVAHFPGAAVTGPVFNTSQHIWKLESDGATVSKLTIDNTDYTTAAGAALGSDQTAIGIGTLGSGAYHFGTGAHGCLIWLRGAPSAAKWAATKALLTREFG